MAGDRLRAIGADAVVRCLELATGKPAWTRDLCAEPAGPGRRGLGYSPSPIACGDTLIIPLGHRFDEDAPDGEGKPSRMGSTGDGSRDDRDRSVIALRLEDGSLAWTSDSHVVWRMTSLIYVGVQTDETICMPVDDGFCGYDLETGERLWKERGFSVPSWPTASSSSSARKGNSPWPLRRGRSSRSTRSAALPMTTR